MFISWSTVQDGVPKRWRPSLEAVKDEMAAFFADIDTSVNTDDVSIHEAEEAPSKKQKVLLQC